MKALSLGSCREHWRVARDELKKGGPTYLQVMVNYLLDTNK